MNNVLVISGHPNLENSYTNKVILSRLEASSEDIVVHRLDERYPDFNIDVDVEQKALKQADVIVLQFPFYWYSVPALMKKWLDDVFSFNFAYGPEGDNLKDKAFILSFTVGGPEEAYTPIGYNHFRIEELIKPLEQTAYLAGMNLQPPVYTHGMVYIPDVYNTQKEVEERANRHADRLLTLIQELSNSAESAIHRLIRRWFSKFDELPENDSFFIKYLSSEVNWQMPEGTFKGHEGFRQWYQDARARFRPDCDHIVEQTSIQKTADDQFETDLRIRLKADTYAGEKIDLLVNETWKLSFGADNHPVIQDYRVVPM